MNNGLGNGRDIANGVECQQRKYYTWILTMSS
jgi:hypothetical protein